MDFLFFPFVFINLCFYHHSFSYLKLCLGLDFSILLIFLVFIDVQGLVVIVSIFQFEVLSIVQWPIFFAQVSSDILFFLILSSDYTILLNVFL